MGVAITKIDTLISTLGTKLSVSDEFRKSKIDNVGTASVLLLSYFHECCNYQN